MRGQRSGATVVSAAPAPGPTVSLSPVRRIPRRCHPPTAARCPLFCLRSPGRPSSFLTPDTRRFGLGLGGPQSFLRSGRASAMRGGWPWHPPHPHGLDLWSPCVGISETLVPLVACHSAPCPACGWVESSIGLGRSPGRWGVSGGGVQARLIGNWYKGEKALW